MLVDTFDVLSAHSLASQEVFARAIDDVLMADLVPSMADVVAKAQIPDQIRSTLVTGTYGDHVLEDLNQMVLLLTRPNGLCHDLLPDGVELCTTLVVRKVTDQTGATTLVRKPGRFVSDDPETVAAFRISTQVERVTNALFRTGQMITDSTQRMPGLSAYTPKHIARMRRVLDSQFPSPNGQNGHGQLGQGGN